MVNINTEAEKKSCAIYNKNLFVKMYLPLTLVGDISPFPFKQVHDGLTIVGSVCVPLSRRQS